MRWIGLAVILAATPERHPGALANAGVCSLRPGAVLRDLGDDSCPPAKCQPVDLHQGGKSDASLSAVAPKLHPGWGPKILVVCCPRQENTPRGYTRAPSPAPSGRDGLARIAKPVPQMGSARSPGGRVCVYQKMIPTSSAVLLANRGKSESNVHPPCILHSRPEYG